MGMVERLFVAGAGGVAMRAGDEGQGAGGRGLDGDRYASRAVDYAERAGRRALEALAYEEACALFARALDALRLAATDPGPGDEGCPPDSGTGSRLGRRLELVLALGDAPARAGDQTG